MVEIPLKFKQLLDGSDLSGPVSTFVTCVTKVLEDRKMPFFPNYTDHSDKHIGRVLKSQQDLIPQEVWESNDETKLIRDVDVAVIVGATLLHDLAMYLHEDGFLALVRGKTDHRPVPWFDEPQDEHPGDLPWPQLWERFVAEAMRFSDRDLVNLVGSRWKVRELPKDVGRWTTKDRLVIGEFIRRHHTRLAHEMALAGFPGLERGTGAEEFPAICDLPAPYNDLADLVGLVARSHGMALRTCTEYLREKHPGKFRILGTAVVYPMALLRVADYLQLDADRAPPVLLQLRNPQSPKSLEEWEKHGQVADIDHETKDPYAVQVDVRPTHGLRTHLQLKELLDGLQQEMDVSTAVLAEVYGLATRYGLDRLQLAKRRVRSNINEQSLCEKLDYVPVRSGFEADPHLLTLLVEPLYGAQPTIGIRELMQNGVDAVRECERFCEKHPEETHDLRFPEQDADVLIQFEELDNGRWRLRVSDKGIGMQESTIRKYFLRAGASFRTDPGWTGEFTDGQRKSEVLRSGRFGVGVFAAFLLGERISVRTRYVTDTTGYRFEAAKDAQLIELTKDDTLSVGTTVEIDLAEETMRGLGADRDSKLGEITLGFDFAKIFDWYTLKRPSVVRRVKTKQGEVRTLPQEFELPSPIEQDLPRHWRCFKPDGYEAVLWTYRSDYCPPLVCNGIRIAEAGRYDLLDDGLSWCYRDLAAPLAVPRLLVFDREANLPLTVTRGDLLQGTVPFDAELLGDVVDDFIAFSLVVAPEQPLWKLPPNSTAYFRGYPLHRGTAVKEHGSSLPDKFVRRLGWFCTSAGTGPSEQWLVSLCPESTVCLHGTLTEWPVQWTPSGNVPADILSSSLHLLVTDDTSEGFPYDYDSAIRFLLRLAEGDVEGEWGLAQGGRLVLRNVSDHLEHIAEKYTVHHRETDQGELYEITLGRADEILDLDALMRSCPEETGWGQNEVPFLMELTLAKREPLQPSSLFAEKWNEYIGPTLIPFDQDARRELIDRVKQIPQMCHHIEAWERMRAEDQEMDGPFFGES